MENVDFKDEWLNTLKDLALLIDKFEGDIKQELNSKLINLIQAFPNQEPAKSVEQYKALQTELIRLLLSEGKNE